MLAVCNEIGLKSCPSGTTKLAMPPETFSEISSEISSAISSMSFWNSEMQL